MGAAFYSELIGDRVQLYFGSVEEVMALYHSSSCFRIVVRFYVLLLKLIYNTAL